MRGPELESLSLDQIVEREIFPSVFARINPLNKLKIIQAFKRRGEVVAMIGDGVVMNYNLIYFIVHGVAFVCLLVCFMGLYRMTLPPSKVQMSVFQWVDRLPN
jgi:high-affinity K+ transport system ATPase subunit B